jgi:hypothetical protein
LQRFLQDGPLLCHLYEKTKWCSLRPSALVLCEDPIAAYVLDEAAFIFGSFVEAETARYANHRKKRGKKEELPDERDVREYRRALMEGTPFQRGAGMKKRKLSSLMHGAAGLTSRGRTITQRRDKPGFVVNEPV